MNKHAKRLSLSGVLLALTVLCLFIESIAPTNRLAFYALSSFFVSVVIMEFGLTAGWTFYIASCLLSLIIVQDKMNLIPYVLFFGNYGIIKFYIEKRNKLWLEYILKFVYFNIVLFFLYISVKTFILPEVSVKFPWWILIVFAEAAFLIYDYVYSLVIQYYCSKIKNVLKI
ncbi:MAG: hypothetical protein N2484_18645 [Clostridia bacterium]|nr:hypothetical protein [Clostridia bacterium]